jgi:hypothetical protein
MILELCFELCSCTTMRLMPEKLATSRPLVSLRLWVTHLHRQLQVTLLIQTWMLFLCLTYHTPKCMQA